MTKVITVAFQITIVFLLLFSVCFSQNASRIAANQYYLQGANFMVKGDAEKAVSCFEKAIKEDPSFSMPYLVLGDHYFKATNYDKAISYYELFLTKNSKESDEFNADVYKRTGDSCMMKILAIKSDSHQDNSTIELEQKYIKKAIDFYKKAGDSEFLRDSERKQLAINLSLSYLYAISGDLDSSEKCFKQVEGEKAINTPEYHFYKGVYFKLKKNYKEALHFFYLVKKESSFYKLAKIEIDYLEKQQKMEKIFYFSVIVVAIFVIVALAYVTVIRSGLRRKEEMEQKYGSIGSLDITFDGVHFRTKQESVSFAINQLNRLVNMPMIMAFMPDKENNKLVSVLGTSIGMANDVEINLKLSSIDLQPWITLGEGKPFIYKKERRKTEYIKAFPNSHTELENLQVRVGVPLITEERVFVGIIYFSSEEDNTNAKNELRKNFEQKYSLLKTASRNLAEIVKSATEQEALLFDKETGMHNSKYYYSVLPKILNAADQVSLIIFEMDGFESISEKLGVVSASRLRELTIKAVFQVLEDRGDFCQIGEARFAIILSKRSFKESTSIAEEMRQALTKVTLTYQGDAVTVTCAIGTYPGTSQSPEKLDSETREALEEGLRHGGNIIVAGDRKPILSIEQVSKTQVLSALSKNEPADKPDVTIVKKPLFAATPKLELPQNRNTLSPHKLKTQEIVKAAFKPISSPIPIPENFSKRIDPVSGLAQKGIMEQTLLSEVEFLKTSPRKSVFLYFCFDNFFELKDPGKLEMLKKLLKTAAPFWISLAGDGGIASKLEENGFAMFIPEKSLRQGLEIADKLRTQTKEKLVDLGRFSLSIGVSSYPELTDNFKSILINARNAMTQAMNTGGDKILQSLK